MSKPLVETPTNFDQLFAHTQSLEGRVGAIEKAVGNMADKLDGLVRIVTTQAAQPPWRVGDILSTSRDLLTIGAILGGTVIFIANALSSAPIASIETRMRYDSLRIERIERAVERMTDAKIAGLR